MTDNRKTILITGCSSGIGYDAAHGLNDHGWRVFATCRKPEDCARLESEGLESFVLDYEDEPGMAAAVAEVLKRTGGTLDALFNNGAYGFPSYLEDVPSAAMRAIFETNFIAQHESLRLEDAVDRRPDFVTKTTSGRSAPWQEPFSRTASSALQTCAMTL